MYLIEVVLILETYVGGVEESMACEGKFNELIRLHTNDDPTHGEHA